MSNETDTALSLEFRRQIILENVSVENCKECSHFNQLHRCANNNLDTESCNLLKTLHIT